MRVDIEARERPMSADDLAAAIVRLRKGSDWARPVYDVTDISSEDMERQVRFKSRWDFWQCKLQGWGIIRGPAAITRWYCSDD